MIRLCYPYLDLFRFKRFITIIEKSILANMFAIIGCVPDVFPRSSVQHDAT